jgi:adenosylcobinamide-GDP ribazoletransferase
MSNLRTALSLLTRIPTSGAVRPPGLSASVPWFPLVGAAVGAVIGGLYVGLALLLPALAAAGVAIGVGLLLTGAFHEDGLADAADALGASSPEEALRIMKDPRHGTFGVAALSLSLFIRASAMSVLVGWNALGAVVAAHALSRGAAVGLIAWLRPAGSGLGASYAEGVSPRGTALGCIAALIIGAVGLGVWILPAVLVTAATAAITGAIAGRRFGGMTGDVLGAGQQLAETGILLLVAGLTSAGLPVPSW